MLRYLFAMTPSAAWNSFLFEWIPPKHRGKIMGILQTGQRGLRATGTLAGGYIFDSIGITIVPIAMVAYPLAGLIPLLVSRSVKKKQQMEAQEEISKEIVDDTGVIFTEDLPTIQDNTPLK